MGETYLCIDLKSYYASVECVDRNLDPMVINLVVADTSRTDKTICLAVSPALKSFGVPGRARLFEVNQIVRDINYNRRMKTPAKAFWDKSCNIRELDADPTLELDFIIAPPRMAHYMEVSASIYNIYLKYISSEDIHVYSIDEVFIFLTPYLDYYKLSARELASKIIADVYTTTGITATAGIGTNMYLAKVAMDILAKKMPADEKGMRIAELDEISYRYEMWDHEPIRDFWRVGRGYTKKLHEAGLYTMGDIARFSLSRYGEDRLYKLFGINAELLIDHAWGWEPCTIADVKSYKPMTNSLSSGQVLHSAYNAEKARIIVMEMADRLVLDMVDKDLVTDQIVLSIGYDKESLADPEFRKHYKGVIETDHYGREIPKYTHGTTNLSSYTSSSKEIIEAVVDLFDHIIDTELLVRRVTIAVNHVIPEKVLEKKKAPEQLNLFMDIDESEKQRQKESAEYQKEKQLQKAILQIQKKYGKNALLKGTNLLDGATMRERNEQVGGHKA
ncbi:MAG: DNA methylase [Anaerotignum sp.]|nr:DNA methylase [Anaerotignum sp.]